MNGKVINVTIIVLLFMAGGCSRKEDGAARRERAAIQAQKPHSQPHVYCEWGKEGFAERSERPSREGYVFYEWTAEGTKGQAVLTDGYGMMIFYKEWEPNAVPRFELYAHDRGVIARTTDLAEFKRELARIPAGKTLRCFNTCGGGTHSAMDRAVIEEIATFCRWRGIVFIEGDDEVICTCA